LMDDIVLPQSLLHPDRPPYASSRQSSYNAASQANAMQLTAGTLNSTAKSAGTVEITAPQPGETRSTERLTILALKSEVIYQVSKYQRDGDLLMFVDVQGRKGGVDVNEVDWRKTSEMTAAARSADTPLFSRQVN
jgi:hypothetical protein